MLKTVICAIAKKENKYINNWCKYHLTLGFDHIYLYDNNLSTAPFVGNYIDEDLQDKITIINVNDKHEADFQNKCYTKFYTENCESFDWCAFIDIDEFINTTFNNINDFLSQNIFNDFEAIKLQWHVFGDDDIIERDESVPVQDFFKIRKSDPNLNCWSKILLRGHLRGIKFVSSHYATKNDLLPKQCIFNGQETLCEKALPILQNETAWINHYVTKTLKEFLEQKLNRTDCQNKDYILNIDYFWRVNEKTFEKEYYAKYHKYFKGSSQPMKYIIMCGGKYRDHTLPHHFLKINGESVIDHTIRLLQEAGIDKTDIAITSSNPLFQQCGVKVIEDSNNTFEQNPVENGRPKKGYWVEAFYHLNAPCVYLFGDVYYSPDCIKKIIEAETNDILFFSSAKPFSADYIKYNVEPIAFKVVNYERFYDAIEKCKKLWDQGKFWRHPIAFDLWCVLQGFPTEYDYLKKNTADVFGDNFVPIYDYTTDIDTRREADLITKVINKKQNCKICVTAICKNELSNLTAWIDSLSDADYFAILDTGSTDGTWEKLQELQKENPNRFFVSQHIFEQFFFDEARNEALKLTPPDTEWILSMDFDERIAAGWRDKIVEADKSFPIYHLYRRDITKRGIKKYIPIRRIFRKNSTVRWVHPVHEILQTAEEQNGFAEYPNLDIRVDHFEDEDPDKLTWYNTLLSSYIGSGKTGWFDYTARAFLAYQNYQLGNYAEAWEDIQQLKEFYDAAPKELKEKYKWNDWWVKENWQLYKKASLKDETAQIDILNDAIKQAYYHRKATAYNKSNEFILNAFKGDFSALSQDEKFICFCLLGNNYLDLKKYDEAILNYKIALKFDSTYREPYVDLSKCYMSIKDFDSAISILKEGLKQSVQHNDWLERDICWTYEPYDMLAIAYYYAGKKLESLGCAYQAAQLNPEDKRLQDNVKRILASMIKTDF